MGITCTYVFTIQDQRRAFYSYWKSNPLLWFCGVFVAFCLLAAFLVPNAQQESHPVPKPTIFTDIANVFPVLFFVGLLLYMGFGSKLQSLRKSPLRDAKMLYIFRDEGIHIETSLLKSDLNWNAYVRVREVKDGFLLYAAGLRSFHWLPYTGFANTAAVKNAAISLSATSPILSCVFDSKVAR